MNFRYPYGHVLYRNLHLSYPLITHGKGAYLYDEKGKQYLDASSGAAVANIGHGVKEVAEAISSQAKKVGYLSGMQFTHQPVENLAEQLSKLLPLADGKVYFLTSGSEAIEASIKLARQYWVERGKEKKVRLISRDPSYHGNTLAALSVSAREHYKDIFRPLLQESTKIPAPYCYRCFCEQEYPDCQLKCAHELEKSIKKLGKETVSAFVTEVIGGASSGAAVPPPEYFPIVRQICDEHEVLLIVDEVMTGAGRTGKWLASQYFDFIPDIIVMGKGITGGYFPLSALAVEKNMVDYISKNDRNFLHAQTYAHHPVGCAAGSATLDFIEKNKLVERSSQTGLALMESLSPFISHPQVGDIRGKGLLLGVEFVKNKKSKAPFPRKKKYVEHLILKAMKRGLILWPNTGQADGINGDLILIAPPFTITQAEVERIYSYLGEILEEMKQIG
ncbi:MAG: aminotransferase class III-fold pyridoxal phosphate-dependent enzyme [Candidatus Aminicenantes bacterium]|nr:aminotransferase class III-fold pyridoxal phosphate-dependent enzyme [Candidatus Aminicenantes bacterium]